MKKILTLICLVFAMNTIASAQPAFEHFYGYLLGGATVTIGNYNATGADGSAVAVPKTFNPTAGAVVGYRVNHLVGLGLGWTHSGLGQIKTVGFYDGGFHSDVNQTCRYDAAFLQIHFDFFGEEDYYASGKFFKIAPYVRLGARFPKEALMAPHNDPSYPTGGIYTALGAVLSFRVWNKLSIILDGREEGLLFNAIIPDNDYNTKVYLSGNIGLAWGF